MKFFRPRLLLVFGLLATCNAAPSLLAQETVPLRSGLQPGDKAGAFNVLDVTGPRKGNSLCYACAFGTHAVVCIQAREISDTLIGVIRDIDALVDHPASIKGASKHAFVVYITDDPESAAMELGEIARQNKIKNIPFTIFDELTGPRDYKVDPEAEVTVMMWKDTVVAVNHAAAAGAVTRELADRVLKDARTHLAR